MFFIISMYICYIVFDQYFTYAFDPQISGKSSRTDSFGLTSTAELINWSVKTRGMETAKTGI